MPKKGKKGKKGVKNQQSSKSVATDAVFNMMFSTADDWIPPQSSDGKKGKKTGSAKAEKDANIKAMSVANSNLWEARLDIVEKARIENRERARELALENDALLSQVEQTEKDTLDVVTYLKRQDEDKDKKIDRVVRELEDAKLTSLKEQEKIATEFQLKIADLEDRLAKKSDEAELLRSELKLMKEFRRKRAQMQRELLEIKDTMLEASDEHKATVTAMEQRFVEEKIKLQKESDSKVAQLAEKAHSQAILNLDETTKSVYKENVQLTRALTLHMQEGEELRKIRGRLEKENKLLKENKEIDDQLIQQKVIQNRQQKKLLKELEDKVATLESSLTHVVREFDTEQNALVARSRLESDSVRGEVVRLQRTIELKTKEMNRIKRLARNILDKRSDVEQFLLDALEHVKSEIAANRLQYRRDAEAAYQQKMLDAYVGKTEFPKIRTFNRFDSSTNSVYKDLEAAEQLFDMASRVDIKDLTWEQKEKVLRHLFAKMNQAAAAAASTSLPQQQQKKAALSPAGAITAAITAGGHTAHPSLMEKEAWVDVQVKPRHDPAFVTEAQVDEDGNFERLPRIDITSWSSNEATRLTPAPTTDATV